MLAGQSRAMRMTRAATGIAVLAFAYSMYAIAGAGAEVIYSGFLLLMSGLPVYVWVARGRA
jgi:APA family basic amino acid/polyamine antiporter